MKKLRLFFDFQTWRYWLLTDSNSDDFTNLQKFVIFFLLFFRYNYTLLYPIYKKKCRNNFKIRENRTCSFGVWSDELNIYLYTYIFFVFRPNQTLHHISSNWWGWFRSLLMPSRQPPGRGCLWSWIPNCSWRRYCQNFHFFHFYLKNI